MSGKPRNPLETADEKRERYLRYKREGMKRYRLKWPERFADSVRRSNARHPERRKAQQFVYALRRNYGMDKAEYDALLEAQGGACAICRNPFGRTHVDHNHETGKVRGLLCTNCNTGLHRIENVAWRTAAEAYLSCE